MSSAAEQEILEARPPRETTALFGHEAAERGLLAAYRSGRIPHAWLIGGPEGIGKATLAYRLARFVLAHPDPASSAVQSAPSLEIGPDQPVARRIAAEAHGDLLVLERVVGESGQLRTVITVEQVRRTVGFFGSTAGEGGWRVCIVDSADELKFPEGANALLKMLEEPPQRSLFLLVSHAPGRLLPTIRSRCRRLLLRPLGQSDVVRAAAAALDLDPHDRELEKAAAAADGRVARAVMLAGGPLLAIQERVRELLARLPSVDPLDLHALGDRLDRADDRVLDVFVETVRDWLSACLAAAANDLARVDRVAETWDRLNAASRDVRVFNLDRKPLVFTVFGWLAETARG